MTALAEDDPKRCSPNWRPPPTRLPRSYIDRQGLITHLAYDHLGGRDHPMSFLNTYHAGFGARPLDLVGDSAMGYSTVRGEVLRLATFASGEQR